jgi:hypothetical protein
MQPGWLRTVLINLRSAGVMSVTPYLDRKPFATMTKNFTQSMTDLAVVPFSPGTSDGVQVFTWDLNRMNSGWKFGVLVTISGDAELSHLGLTAQELAPVNTTQTEAKDWSSRR